MPDGDFRQRRGRNDEAARNEVDEARMNADALDFHLPPELIAQTPSADRAASRLLHYDRAARSIAHRTFADLPSILRAGDLLVFNNARVIPARFSLRKETGGRVEALFLGQTSPRRWRVLLKNLGPARDAVRLEFVRDSSLSARVIEKGDDGECLIELDTDEPAETVLVQLSLEKHHDILR